MVILCLGILSAYSNHRLHDLPRFIHSIPSRLLHFGSMAGNLGGLSPRYLPWAPLDIREQPVPVVTAIKLERANWDDRYCATALATSGFTYRLLGKSCSQPGTVLLSGKSSQLGSDFVATCPLAVAAAMFLHHVAEPKAFHDLHSHVDSLITSGPLLCHGDPDLQGKEVDLLGVALADGRQIAVGRDWKAPGSASDFLHHLWQGACGLFHGVQSQDTPGAQKDRLHLDMESGRICR